jgi:sugar lactone lactonase YvrE
VGLTGTGTGPLGVFPLNGTSSVLGISGVAAGSAGCSASTLCDPAGVAMDGAGNLYIADNKNNRVVKVTPAGVGSVMSMGSLSPALGNPNGVAVDSAGNVFVADTQNNRVVELTPEGVASELSTPSIPAGSGCGHNAGLCDPGGVVVDALGDIYIADTGNSRVVEVTSLGVTTVLNTGSLTLGAHFGLGLDSTGDVYIADSSNNRVVEVTTAGVASVLNTGPLALNSPTGVAVDAAGDVYITDYYNDRVVEVTAAGAASVVGLGGLSLGRSNGLAVDGAGNLYIADGSKNRVVMVSQTTALPLSFSTTGTGDSSAQQTVILQNAGNQPLLLSALSTTTTGQSPSIFDLNGPTTCTASTSLAAGAGCSLGIEFAPAAPGSFSGSVNIADNNLNRSNAAQTIQLSGVGAGFAASITLSENPGSSVSYGVPVTVTATLSGGNGVPTGSIGYSVDGETMSGATLSPGGQASFVLSGTLSVGQHDVVVSYAGDANYTESTPSASFTMTVNAVTTQTTLSAPSNATTGQSVALVATVVAGASSSPVTSGVVTFALGSTVIGAASLASNGEAILNTTMLPAGSDSITASYVASGNNAGSTSASSTVVVTSSSAATLAVVATHSGPIFQSGPGVLTLFVANSSGNATLGTATVTDTVNSAFTINSVSAGCAVLGQVVTCSILPGSTADLTTFNIYVTASASAGGTGGGNILNTATLTDSTDSVTTASGSDTIAVSQQAPMADALLTPVSLSGSGDYGSCASTIGKQTTTMTATVQIQNTGGTTLTNPYAANVVLTGGNTLISQSASPATVANGNYVNLTFHIQLATCNTFSLSFDVLSGSN